MPFTYDQLAQIMPAAHKAGRLTAWYPHLVEQMQAHDIVTPPREQMFLATVAEETGELQAQEENLRYSGQRLREVFPSMFAGNPALADQLAAQGPEAIANYIYADANRAPGYRLGNVNPGDGWRYRGRGPMQLTGRGNYARYFASLGLSEDTDPDIVATPELGAWGAAHFWKVNGCNEIADTGDFYALTRRVNGGQMNMGLRLQYFSAAKAAIDGRPPPAAVGPMKSKTNTSIVVGTATLGTAAGTAADIAPSVADAAKDVLPEATRAMFAPGAIKWVIIGIAAIPLIYALIRLVRKQRRGELVNT